MSTAGAEVPVVWTGCYEDGWKGEIVPAAFAHPAKMARGLVRRIFSELIKIGALAPGDTVVDPFAGIGSTMIEGTARGMHVVLVELEPKFCELARLNYALHCRDWADLLRPKPIILQGDSRRLRDVLAAADAIVSSPPYARNGLGHQTANGVNLTPQEQAIGHKSNLPEYGRESGQLGRMVEGSVDALVASPPYAVADTGAGGLNTKPAKDGQQGGRSVDSPSQDTDQRYGEADGQIARLPAGEVTAIVASPPFTQGYSGGGGINKKGYGADGADKVGDRSYQGTAAERSDGNLETLPLGEVLAPEPARETFWTAAAEIVRESFAVLKPGGYAVWVTKRFIRDKKIQPFDDDWQRLCEHVGFQTVKVAHASLVSEETTAGLFGDTTKRRERKSFFRRLAEKNGSPKIDWETVLFVRKPL